MDIPGKNFFAYPGLAQQDDCGIQIQHFVCQPEGIQGMFILRDDVLREHFSLHMLQFLFQQAGLFLVFFHFCFQVIYFRKIPHIGDDHNDLMFIIVNGGAGDQRLFAGFKLLVEGNGTADLQHH